MKRKIILIALLILAILAVAFIFIKTRKIEETTLINPPHPELPNYISGKLPIEFLVQKEDFTFPAELPSLSISKRIIDKDTVTEFVTKLNLNGNIEEFEDINEGIKYYVNTDEHFFIATPKTSIVKFGLAVSDFPQTINKSLTDPELTQIATSFLIENNFYSEGQIKPLPVSYLKRSNTSEGLESATRETAEVFQVGFLFQALEYEILTTYSAQPLIYVQILPNGKIYNMEVLLISNIQKGITEYPLKTYEDVTANTGEAKLISLYGDYISPIDITIKDITSLQVDKIRLVYLLEQGKEDILQPIYILEGPVKITGSSVDTAALYMPAYK